MFESCLLHGHQYSRSVSNRVGLSGKSRDGQRMIIRVVEGKGAKDRFERLLGSSVSRTP